MALPTKTVKLSRPAVAFGKSYNEIFLRQPSARIFFELGPLTANYRSGSIESTHELPGVLSSYLERCTTNVDDPGASIPVILDALSLEDGVRVRRTFSNFFHEAIETVLAEEAAAAMAASEAQT